MSVAPNAFRSAALRSTVLILAGLVSFILLVPLVVVFLLLGLSWWLSIPVALILGALLAWWWTQGAAGRVMSQLGLTEAERCTDAGLVNVVEGLSLSIGTAEPDLYLLEDPALNALPLVTQQGGAIVVTSGLLESLGRMELEGVVAELLVRIKSGEAEVATSAAGSFGYPFFDGWLAWLGSSVGTWAMRRVIASDGDIEADRKAVGVTRYPPGLTSALVRISKSYIPAKATAGNDHLWIAPPLTTEAAIPHSPLQWRIDILLEF